MIKKISALGVVLGGLLMAPMAFAVADQDVLDAASSTATVLKENVIGGVTTALPIVIIAGALVLVIFVVWRLGKRFLSGR